MFIKIIDVSIIFIDKKLETEIKIEYNFIYNKNKFKTLLMKFR